ncbi:FAD-dependent oxidoreductase [Chrysiogenes arsenatis]|uniref:FAD-dependent oxidoreductase n=1 Tax=Chrysiogenes arsenatis TaxID=309797 RepID=UPI000423D730|nr:FAD-dependent oxidoreductase [Chrysiogenes arsenatis]
MAQLYDYDLIILGSGPAGLNAALQGVELGKRVALVEEHGFEGGNYLHNGTIPSKTLREAVLKLTGLSSVLSSRASLLQSGECEIDTHSLDHCSHVTFADLERETRAVIAYELSTVRKTLQRHNVAIISGKGSIQGAHSVQVRYEGKLSVCSGEHIVIATGSVPRRPADVPIDNEIIFDSTGLLAAGRIPRTMIVVGGGVIGTEYASIFAHLGTQVTLLDSGQRPLRFLDEEIGDHLLDSLGRRGLRFVPNQAIVRIYRDEHDGVVETTDGTFRADLVLYALGRLANTTGLGLAEAGIALDKYGYIAVNSLYQTAIPSIYAIGDVIGWPSLASTSALQGRKVVAQIYRASSCHFPETFPFGVYTIPEISMVGRTAAECRALGFAIQEGKAHYHELPRGIISSDIEGMLKLVTHRDTGEILGVHIIGTSATELIHTGYVAMMHADKASLFRTLVFNTPTFSEAYRVAALSLLAKEE